MVAHQSSRPAWLRAPGPGRRGDGVSSAAGRRHEGGGMTLTPELRGHFVRLLRSQVGPITKARTFVALAEDAGIRLGTPGRQSGKTATVAAFARGLGLEPRTVRWWLRALRDLADDAQLLDAVEREM